MRVALHLIPVLLLFPALFSSLSVTANDDDDSFIHQFKHKIAHLGISLPHNTFSSFLLLLWVLSYDIALSYWSRSAESVLAESIRNLNEKIDYIEQREKRIDDMSQKILHLQSVLSTLKVCFRLQPQFFKHVQFGEYEPGKWCVCVTCICISQEDSLLADERLNALEEEVHIFFLCFFFFC